MQNNFDHVLQSFHTATVAELESVIAEKQKALSVHPMYARLKSINELRTFMSHHIYAVWDFMSLLKGLQKEITCVEVPWQPSPYSKKLVRLINEIVLGEESDMDHKGGVSDHFSLYIEAMKEVGIETSDIERRLKNLEFSDLRSPIKNFVSFNIELAKSRNAHLIAGAFFFGREKLIPDMFTGLLNELRAKNNIYPALEYYLERHIELDGDEHSHAAKDCLVELCGSDSLLYAEALKVGIHSLDLRSKLWDDVLTLIK